VLYAHLAVIEGDASSFSLSALGSTNSFSQKRWMMPRHTLGPCYVHFGHVMDAWCPLQAQNVHNKTQSFYGQHEDVCLGTTNYIFDG